MKTPIVAFSIATLCAAAFVGCEWGGVHSGESWNDAYSWANFSGTYKLVSAVDASSSDSGSSGSSSSSSQSETSTTTTVTTTNTYTTSMTFSFSEGKTTYSGLKTPVMPGKTTISFTGFDDTFTDNGDGTFKHASGEGNATATINYTAGSVYISIAGQRDPCTMIVKYTYYTITTKTTTNGTTTTTTTNPSSSSSSTKKTAVPVIWLNLTQKGNLLTFEDNNGVVYSGRITGASCPKADDGGYLQAGHIRFSFEAKSAGGASITGSLSGDWSGASSKTTGTIANRTIDASYHNGKSATQFQAVSGTTVVSPKEITAAVGVTE